MPLADNNIQALMNSIYVINNPLEMKHHQNYHVMSNGKKGFFKNRHYCQIFKKQWQNKTSSVAWEQQARFFPYQQLSAAPVLFVFERNAVLCWKVYPRLLSKHFLDTQNPTFAIAGREAQDTELTSNVISNKFFGICIMPVSPSSPETQIQGFDVVITLLSFLMGIITVLYGITVMANSGNYRSV